jgi:hypothetical protein
MGSGILVARHAGVAGAEEGEDREAVTPVSYDASPPPLQRAPVHCCV